MNSVTNMKVDLNLLSTPVTPLPEEKRLKIWFVLLYTWEKGNVKVLVT